VTVETFKEIEMSKISKAAAEKLWNEIRENAFNLEKNLLKAIESKSWEPLGYDSFIAVYNDRLKGIRLATDWIKINVVYAMLEVDDDTTAVTSTLGLSSGVSRETVERIKHLKDSGRTPEEAEGAGLRVRVAANVNPALRETRVIVVGDISHETYALYEKKARMQRSSVRKLARAFIEEGFERL
jgi:hypothetical protein